MCRLLEWGISKNGRLRQSYIRKCLLLTHFWICTMLGNLFSVTCVKHFRERKENGEYVAVNKVQHVRWVLLKGAAWWFFLQNKVYLILSNVWDELVVLFMLLSHILLSSSLLLLLQCFNYYDPSTPTGPHQVFVDPGNVQGISKVNSLYNLQG